MVRNLLLVAVLCYGLSCTSDRNTPAEVKITFTKLPTPIIEGGEGNLFVNDKKEALLSWVAYIDDSTDALLYSRLINGKWSTPVEAARGNDWFVNWADFPSMVQFPGEPDRLAAHWLQKSAAGTYDYDVRIAISEEGGENWNPSFIPHRDSIAAEHGFVSMVPLPNGRVLATWLDGRNTKTGASDTQGQDHGHGHGGAMTLRAAEFDAAGRLYEEVELDQRVCDCCQTDIALSRTGSVIVYRDRSEEEIRDISIVRQVGGNWTKPQKVHEDNWKIAGCPVNGPAIVAGQETLAVAWFTGANGESKVQVALSSDEGKTFTGPIRVDDGNPLGRVDIELYDDKTVIVSWLEQVEEAAEIRAALIGTGGKLGNSHTLVQTDPSRQSGFPVLKKRNQDFLLAWTAVDSISTVKSGLFSVDP